jgi:Na+/H+-dicarboxylate symporter
MDYLYHFGGNMLEFLSRFKVLFLILFILFGAVFLGENVPVSIKEYTFTFSFLMRNVLMFLLPFLIFPYMAGSIASMKTTGVYLVGAIMFLILFSNFISIIIPYFVGSFGIPLLGLSKVTSLDTTEELQPLFDLGLQPLLSMESAMLIALCVGIYIGLSGTNKFDHFIEKYKEYANFFFEKIFIPTLPLYVLGTALKISHEMDLKTLLPVFGGMILLILITQVTYIFFVYWVGAGFKFKKAVQSFENAFPSCIVGFSTMSSVVTMPVTMRAAEQNIEDPTIARIAISTTVNTHVIGECISLPMIALTLFFMVNGHMPDFSVYLIFAFFTALAQFGGVAVPGGSIVIILPFLSQYLGFSTEMISMIIALSIFLDPLGTANNVLGNGGFAMVIDRFYRFSSRLFFQKKVEK